MRKIDSFGIHEGSLEEGHSAASTPPHSPSLERLFPRSPQINRPAGLSDRSWSTLTTAVEENTIQQWQWIGAAFIIAGLITLILGLKGLFSSSHLTVEGLPPEKKAEIIRQIKEEQNDFFLENYASLENLSEEERASLIQYVKRLNESFVALGILLQDRLDILKPFNKAAFSLSIEKFLQDPRVKQIKEQQETWDSLRYEKESDRYFPHTHYKQLATDCYHLHNNLRFIKSTYAQGEVKALYASLKERLGNEFPFSPAFEQLEVVDERTVVFLPDWLFS